MVLVKKYIMKSLDTQLKEVPNKIFLLELQNRLRENKIKEKELAIKDKEINPCRGEVYRVEIIFTKYHLSLVLVKTY